MSGPLYPSHPDKTKTAPGGGPATPAEAVVSPMTTFSTHVDPLPHYTMSGASGLGAWVAYARMGNPRNAVIAGAAAAMYAYAGYKIGQGETKMGYDVGTLASVGLLAATGKHAWTTSEAWATSMAGVGGVSALLNLPKAYQVRTGRPADMA
ncbi:hypothetical protein H9P43_002150 [Blastocladiella emersonii ATCC 22665]|nr:hypothetical protein H9P43_002150 [Blastocladiella emersonii ATCC 22665]